jgi:general secretion pathway protein J
MARKHGTGRQSRGFTLVEVMVALVVMSLLAVMAWQGVDGMIRARDASQRRMEATLRLNTALAQWQQDLAQVQETPSVAGLRFDGASLQLTRRTAAGLQIVVWSLRAGRWLRWAGAPATVNRALLDSLSISEQLQGTEATQVTVLEGLSDWQVYFYRGNAWSNAQSSGDVVAPVGGAASAAARQSLPGGVRLVLNFADGSGFVGSLTRDTVLGPQQ